jgi:hypothetical protein
MGLDKPVFASSRLLQGRLQVIFDPNVGNLEDAEKRGFENPSIMVPREMSTPMLESVFEWTGPAGGYIR